jgi:putative phage-type endonuclease
MIRKTAIPESIEHWLKMREEVLTSTEISTLFDLNKYQSRYELFMKKSGQLDIPFEESERMKWGNRLEESIAHGAAEENGWDIREMNEFIVCPDYRIGSSFDFCIQDSSIKTPMQQNTVEWTPRDYAILEVKNVDSLIYYNEWTEFEAPPHIELQVQHQMLVAGLSEAYIVALVGGNELKQIHRKANEAIQNKILEAATKFWHDIDNNIQPEPDFEQDSSVICELYKSTDGSSYDATDNETIYDLASRYKQAMEDEKDAKARKDALKAQIFTIVDKAEKVYGAGFSISCKERDPYEVKAHTRNGFRDFRITWKKGEKE